MQPIPSSYPEQEADADRETNKELYQHFTKLVSSWPSSNGISPFPLYRHEKGWNSTLVDMVGSMVADSCFAARPSDIIVATLPKSGTTWIKSLLYTTVHRRRHPVGSADHPLNTVGPHECIKFFELQLYTRDKVPRLDTLTDPRLFATHVPFVSLPRTVIAGAATSDDSSGCKVVYVCREPKDHLISLWEFINKISVREGRTPLSLEATLQLFCDGQSPFGSYWDHVLGYWRAHLAHPDKVLFFKYEEMQRDPAAHVRRLARFTGHSFSAKEEEDGVVDAIVRMCSFEHMKGLEATRSGKTMLVLGEVNNNFYFRKGVVGDWVTYLSPEMARRIDTITEEKFRDSGFIY